MQGRLTRFVVAAISTVALVPALAGAQWVTSRSNADSSDTCGAYGCTWLTFTNFVASLSLGRSAARRSTMRFLSAVPFTMTGDEFSSSSDCPACKDNDRPFFMPPGIEKKLARLHRGVNGEQNGGDENGADGAHEGGPPAQTPGGVGIGAQGGVAGGVAGGVGQDPPGGAVAGAVTPSVVVTPEPAALVLLATGLLALAPFLVRTRRRER